MQFTHVDDVALCPVFALRETAFARTAFYYSSHSSLVCDECEALSIVESNKTEGDTL